MILWVFWQYKIDIKRLFKGGNVKILGWILGWICHSFHGFTHFVKLCRDRHLRAFKEIHPKKISLCNVQNGGGVHRSFEQCSKKLQIWWRGASLIMTFFRKKNWLWSHSCKWWLILFSGSPNHLTTGLMHCLVLMCNKFNIVSLWWQKS